MVILETEMFLAYVQTGVLSVIAFLLADLRSRIIRIEERSLTHGERISVLEAKQGI